jgi:hypothetical protein
MNRFVVYGYYRHNTLPPEIFLCQAENPEHAVEQMKNMYPEVDTAEVYLLVRVL